MKIAVVTDSTSYLTAQEIADNHITIIPIPVIMDGKVYNEGVDVSNHEYYEMLKTSASFPSTSQPAVGELIQIYENLRDTGYDAIISIHLASTISGFSNTVANVAADMEGVQVYGYDSQITVRLMGQLALQAARMANTGEFTPAEIIAELDALRATTGELFVVDDLQNLVRGGRLSNAGAFIGSVLKIKPLLTFDDNTHEIVAFEKVRSMKKAKARVEDLFADAVAQIDYPIRITVYHADDLEAGQTWFNELQMKYPALPIELAELGPVIGTHLGAGALAVAWIKDELA